MEEKPKQWILVDVFKCTGCRVCEVACSLKHESLVWPSASRIQVYEPYPSAPIPVTCVQCDDYPCIASCPTSALSVDAKTGAVLVNPEKCTLCGTCKSTCPASVPRVVPGKSYVLICDLCGGEPECVKVCNELGYGALKLVTKPEGGLVKTFLRDPYGVSREVYLRNVLGVK